MSGWIAGPAAFVASFVAFEGLLFVINVAVGMDASVFTAHVVARMFAINAASFGVLFAAHALGARKKAFVPARHA